MKRNTDAFALIALTGALIAAPQLGRADLYVMRTTPGYAVANAMSSNGVLTGELASGHAYTFDGTNVTDYGNALNGIYLYGYAVNDNGVVVGASADSNGKGLAGYLSAPGNGFSTYSLFGGTQAYFTGVSDRYGSSGFADLAGTGTDTNFLYHAFGADAISGYYTVFPEPAGTLESFANRVSNNGGVAGAYVPSGSNARGFYWNQDNNQVITAGTLADGTFSEMIGIDRGDNILVGEADSFGSTYAVRWDKTNLVQLQPLNPNNVNDAAYGVRSDNRTVGVSKNAAGIPVAALWSPSNVQDLNTISVNPDGTAPKISLLQAVDIDEAGQIGCNAYDPHNNNTPYAVRLDPVGPTAITAPAMVKAAFKGKVTLNMPAPTDVAITLTADSTRISFVKDPIIIKKGKTSAKYSARVSAGMHGQVIHITATNSGLFATATVTTN